MAPKISDENSSSDMSSDDVSSEGTLAQEDDQTATRRPMQTGELMSNNPNDEVFNVENSHNIETPPRSADGKTVKRQDHNAPAAQVPGARLMTNNPNDEMVPVTDSEVVATPHKESAKNSVTRQEDNRLSSETQPGSAMHAHHQHMVPEHSEENSEDDDDENEEEDDSEYRAQGYTGQRPGDINMNPEPAVVLSNLEYNPEEYAKVNASASQEIQDLFRHILDFSPFVAELPTKLRPFIPEYIPVIGDLDPFVKIPRPDGRPDGLGLYVVDEPAIPQSNPAVVLLELRATNVHAATGVSVVDSFEDAANRPEVIDRWIADLKKVHYKKALPTVNYQKPMPDIENLMQVWPQSFEDVLNSDISFPPPNIDLDIDQYVRTLCAVLDIPTYQSLIDPLHVMFTLYQDFRVNQHFQHE